MDTGSSGSTWRYIPSFDGLRALAVLVVVGFHGWPDIFSGGFIGVDVFFALSGYLITGLLLHERQTSGSVDLRAFWGRRVRRLVPAVWVLVSVCSLWMVLVQTASYRAFFDSIGALTWTTNWVGLALKGSEIVGYNPSTVLDHLWSLAVEEQFYLLWPLALIGLMGRVQVHRSRLFVVGALALVSVAVMGLADQDFGYFSTVTRAFEFLGGAIVAMVGLNLSARAARAALLVGMLAFSTLVFVANPTESVMYPWGFIAVSLTSVTLVAALASTHQDWSAILTGRLIAHLGAVSYGIYLWHVPILRFLSSGRVGFGGVGLAVFRLLAIAAFVEGSYWVIEHPIRTRSWKPSNLMTVSSAIVVVASVAALGVAAQRDYSARFDTTVAMPEWDGESVKVLVFGDLIGAVYGSGLDGSDGLTVWNATDVGCSFAPDAYLRDGDVVVPDGFCRSFAQRWQHAIEDFDPDVVVVGGGYWDLGPRFSLDTNSRVFENAAIKGEVPSAADLMEMSAERRATTYRSAIDRSLDALAASTGGAARPVIWVSTPDLEPLAGRETDGTGVQGSLKEWVETSNSAYEESGAYVLTLPEGSDLTAAQGFARGELAELIEQIAG